MHERALNLLHRFLQCPKHFDKQVEFYCTDEEKFCCGSCAVTEHRLCVNLTTVAGMSKKETGTEHINSKSTSLLDSLSNLSSHIQSVVCLIKERENEIKKIPDLLTAELQEMKQKVIRLLDTVEENLMTESKSVTKGIAIKHSNELHELDDIASEITTVTYLAKNIMKNLPPGSAEICDIEASKIVRMLERKITARGPTFETEDVQMKTDTILETVVNLELNDTDRLATIQKINKSYNLPKLNDNFLLSTGMIQVVDSKNCIATNSPGIDPRYNAVQFLPDSSFILTDSYYGICCLFNANSEPLASVNLAVNDVTDNSFSDTNLIYPSCLAGGVLAVSVSAKKKICFFSTDDMLKEKGEIVCKNTPGAIHGLRNGDIAVLWNNPSAFGIISLLGSSYRDKIYIRKDNEGKVIKHNRRMAVAEDRCHVVMVGKNIVDEGTKTIICYDFEANRIFEYRNSNIIDPRGIALDKDGNIYLCEHKHGRIYVLSAEGLLSRVIQDGCPISPFAIGFSRKENKFAVTCAYPKYQSVIFFSILPHEI